jgi:anti-anti-sigma factor
MTSQAPNLFSATVQSVDGGMVVMLVGELDMATAPELSEVLESCLAAGPPEVIVDLGGLTFVDSSGISVLVRAQQDLIAQGRQLAVRSPRQLVKRVLEIAGLTDYLNARDVTDDQAV